MMNHYEPNTVNFQATFLVEDGASPQEVDQVNEDFGMPMGPFKVRDLSGNRSKLDKKISYYDHSRQCLDGFWYIQAI